MKMQAAWRKHQSPYQCRRQMAFLIDIYTVEYPVPVCYPSRKMNQIWPAGAATRRDASQESLEASLAHMGQAGRERYMVSRHGNFTPRAPIMASEGLRWLDECSTQRP